MQTIDKTCNRIAKVITKHEKAKGKYGNRRYLSRLRELARELAIVMDRCHYEY